MSEGIYVIEYKLRGSTRSFVIRHPKITNEEAWHWASCHAGVGVISRFSGERNIKKVSGPTAERYGIKDVRWKPVLTKLPTSSETARIIELTITERKVSSWSWPCVFIDRVLGK